MPTKKATKKPRATAKTDAAFLAFAKKQKAAKEAAKKTTKKAAKKPAKKTAKKAPKKTSVKKSQKVGTTVENVVVAPVVSSSGIVTMNPVPDDVAN